LSKEFGEISGEIKILKEKLEKQKEVEKRIKDLKSEIEELKVLKEKCLKYIKELDEFYSYLKNEAIPEIVEIASEIFVRLTDYEFERLEYVEDKDKFDIVAIKKGESFDPKNLSGGQQTLYSLSLRFAIGIWSKKNSGLEKIDCIILDEPTIHLDDSAIERLKNEIENLGIEQMIIVTHDQIFPKIANKIFEVTIDKGFSKIKEEKN
jgi:exonuclease SbcC